MARIELDSVRRVVVDVALGVEKKYAVISEDGFYIVDPDDPTDTNKGGLRGSVKIVHNTLSSTTFGANVLIEHYYYEADGRSGYVDFIGSILNIHTPSLMPQEIIIQAADKEIWENVDEENIKQHISNKWNTGLSP